MNPFSSALLYADDNYAVFYKPAGLPSAPLDENDCNNALAHVSTLYPSVLTVNSIYKAIEKGLIHRIDTQTSGLLLFAGNQKTYDYFIDLQKNDGFIKEYTSFSINATNKNEYEDLLLIKKGFPSCPWFISKELPLPINIISSFRNFGPCGKEVRPVLKDTVNYYAKTKAVRSEYMTELFSISQKNVPDYGTLVRSQCRISKGFRHQVRCHLSWVGLPVIGDDVYGIFVKKSKREQLMLFFASSLCFKDPQTKKIVSYSLDEDFFDSIFLTSLSK